jgi:acyl-CoA synthetase (AMP-forming)/AMP-acid ligase II
MPSEVENVILEMREILSVEVYAEPNPLTGQVVCARVILADQDEAEGITERIRAHCLARLSKYQVPVKITIDYKDPCDARFKKLRGSKT